MIQFSIYGRIVNGNDALEKHMKRLVNSLPPEESVRCLTVTEKQYASMKLLVGLPLFQEKSSQGQSNAAVLICNFSNRMPAQPKPGGRLRARASVVHPG